MFKCTLKKALRKNRIFRVGKSFLFAVNIPDDTIGISGSRCSNCGSPGAYCIQRCRHCGFPLIGPFGFPQLPTWKIISPEQKITMVKEVFAQASKRGRIEYLGISSIPLTAEELNAVEHLPREEDAAFSHVHKIAPKEIRKTLLSLPI